MRRILLLIALIAAAWASLPGAAMAHETPHDMLHATAAASEACAGCVETVTDEDGQAEHCHQGFGCGPAIYSLAEPGNPTVSFPVVALALHAAAPPGPRSVIVSKDLPPPRS